MLANAVLLVSDIHVWSRSLSTFTTPLMSFALTLCKDSRSPCIFFARERVDATPMRRGCLLEKRQVQLIQGCTYFQSSNSSRQQASSFYFKSREGNNRVDDGENGLVCVLYVTSIPVPWYIYVSLPGHCLSPTDQYLNTTRWYAFLPFLPYILYLGVALWLSGLLSSFLCVCSLPLLDEQSTHFRHGTLRMFCLHQVCHQHQNFNESFFSKIFYIMGGRFRFCDPSFYVEQTQWGGSPEEVSQNLRFGMMHNLVLVQQQPRG